MNLSLANGYLVKEELYKGAINFTSHTFKGLLVRDGFTFASQYRKYLINIQTNTGVIPHNQLVISSTAKTFTRSDGGSFITDGFVPGNYIAVSDSGTHATGLYRATSVSATVLRVSIETGSLVSYTYDAGVDEHDMTIYANDELTTADDAGSTYKYTQGSAIAPATTEFTFTVDGDNLSLNSKNMSDFITLASGKLITDYSPGVIVYDDTHASDIIICYASFSPWALQF